MAGIKQSDIERLMMLANQPYGGSSVILQDFLDQSLNCPLNQVRIVRRDRAEYEGKGWLYTVGKSLRIDVVGEHRAGADFDLAAGQLLTIDDKWTFEANSVDGTTKLGGFGKVSKYITHCSIDVEHLEMSEFRNYNTNRVDAYLRPTNGDIPFNQLSTISDDNPVFVSQPRLEFDWLKVHHSGADFFLRRFQTGRLKVLIESRDEIDLKRYLKAFLNSLSLLLGEEVEAFAAATYTPTGLSVSIVPGRQERAKVPAYPLVEHEKGSVEQFMQLGLGFFLCHGQGNLALLFLRMVWDAHKSGMDVRELAASTAVEGIAKEYILKLHQPSESERTAGRVAQDKEWSKYKKKARKLVDGCELLHLPVEFHTAMKLAVSCAPLLTAEESIIAAGRAVNVEIPVDLIDKWKAMRNKAAHGALPLLDLDQSRLTNFYAALTISHLLILGLLGYNGKFTDYSQLDWPEIDFPICESQK